MISVDCIITCLAMEHTNLQFHLHLGECRYPLILGGHRQHAARSLPDTSVHRHQ